MFPLLSICKNCRTWGQFVCHHTKYALWSSSHLGQESICSWWAFSFCTPWCWNEFFMALSVHLLYICITEAHFSFSSLTFLNWLSSAVYLSVSFLLYLSGKLSIAILITSVTNGCWHYSCSPSFVAMSQGHNCHIYLCHLLSSNNTIPLRRRR